VIVLGLSFSRSPYARDGIAFSLGPYNTLGQ